MNQSEVNIVLQTMSNYLDVEQLVLLRTELEKCVVVEKVSGIDNTDMQNAFIAAKRLEGCSEKTLKYYSNTISAMTLGISKDYREITTEDLRIYLAEYQLKNNASKVTVDNVRRNLSSFFGWLEDEDYVLKSPVRRIHKLKTTTIVKDTYSDEEMEMLRDYCSEIRDLAIIDMLASTGMRVGELVLLNKKDIDFTERECIVLGKGDKERIVYFDAKAKLHLEEYLETREDDNPALFVSLRAPHKRLQIGGVECRLRKIGTELNIKKVHPHKFRRTMSTVAIDKGMPIEQLQKLLGHSKIDTTLHYAMVKQSNVKNAHRKYIG